MSELVKCVECGGNVLISSDGKRGKCEYCDQEYFYKEEKDSALVMAMNIATEYLKKCDFDNAIVHYEAILKKHPKDSEAAWGLLLSKYGIEYVRDDRFGKMIPTCHRYVEESIFNSKAYLTAIGECAKEQRAIYERKAAAIDKLQKKIKSTYGFTA